VSFAAISEDGSPVTTLTREDVRVLDDGASRRIIGFEQQADAPLQLFFVIDTSASQERVLPWVKAAAQEFVSAALRTGVDEAGVISFTGKPKLEQEMTDDLATVRAAIGRVKFMPPAGYIGGGVVIAGPPPRRRDPAFAAGASAIWDALYATGAETMWREKPNAQRAVVLITDGIDTYSEKKLSDAVSQIIKAGGVVHAIGLGDENNFGEVAKGELRKIAERTGGRAFFPKKAADIQAAFALIRRQLFSRYIVTFDPTGAKLKDAFHQFRVEIVNQELRRQGIAIAHPEGFFVSGSSGVVKP
jgi:VWFA-related protein